MADFLLTYGWIVWLAIALTFGIIEMFTLELTAAMLGVAALGGLVVSLTPAPFWLQLVVACVLAVLLLWLARPPLLALMKSGADPAPTNIAAILGQTGTVLSTSNTVEGLVKLANGETWTARADAGILSTGSTVVVSGVDGATAVVVPV